MEFVSLKQKIDEASKDKVRNVHLFGTDNFRSWMLYFEPDDGSQFLDLFMTGGLSHLVHDKTLQNFSVLVQLYDIPNRDRCHKVALAPNPSQPTILG